MGRPTIFREHTRWWFNLLPAVDIVTAVITGLIAWETLNLFLGATYPEQIPQQFYYAIAVAAIITPTCFSWMGLYRPWRGQSVFGEVRALVASWSLVFLLLAALALVTKSGNAFSRMWLGTWFLTGLFGFSAGRVALRGFLHSIRARGYNQKSIVLVGSAAISRSVISHLHEHPWAGLNVLGFFTSDEIPGNKLQDIPKLGTIDELFQYIERPDTEINQIWLALPLSEDRRMVELLGKLRSTGVDVCYVPDIFGMRMLQNEMLNIAGLPVMNLTASPITGANRVIKEIEDKVLASLILFMISPLMLAIAVAVKLTSSGPVLYRQIRHGWDGREIEIYKFRTMYCKPDEGPFRQATLNDSRITPLGRFLRQTSLDELPQFINVLQGRMSVVGPRPHALEHNALFEGQVDRYRLRHKVKPGITGWAQVNGFRGETDTLYKMKKRVEYDLFYIENWSFAFDIKIVFLTLIRGFIHKNAY